MSADRLEQIGREITARVEKLDKLGAKAVDQVDSIDYLLAEAKKLCETAEAFAAFKQKHCPELGRSRTYELLAIKEGRKGREEIRALTRARVAKHRAGKRAVTDKPSVTAQTATGKCLEKAAALEQKADVLDDPLVIPTGGNSWDIKASPWFESKIKPIFEGAIKNDASESASAFAQFKRSCARFLPLMTSEDLQGSCNMLEVIGCIKQDVEYAIDRKKEAAAKAKRIKAEAKNPDKAKEKAREKAQEEAMSDDYEEAKAEARQNGEAWGDLKDEWMEQWITDNWDEGAEADFEREFQEQWQEDHGKPWATANGKAAA
jgi:hypothetical protein